MGGTALIISSPTKDVIHIRGESYVKPGGPALYAGATLAGRGYRVLALGPYGYETLETVKVESMLGVERLGYYYSDSPGMVFAHFYRGGSRISRVDSRAPGIDQSLVVEAVREASPDIVLLSPVYGEEAGPIVQLLASAATNSCLAVDVQGYVRVYGGLWAQMASTGRYTIIHASSDDFGVGEALGSGVKGVIVHTSGVGPIRIVKGGKVSMVIEPPIEEYHDPTGAGDIFTSLLAAEYCRTHDLPWAVWAAAKATPGALESIHGAIRGVIKSKP